MKIHCWITAVVLNMLFSASYTSEWGSYLSSLVGWPLASKESIRINESSLSIDEFELINGTGTEGSRPVSSNVNQSCIEASVQTCLLPQHNLVILGKAHVSDYCKKLSDVSEFCTSQKITCHFAIDGNDLLANGSIKDVVQSIDRLGHIIIIEPSTSDCPTKLTASAFLHAVSTSAKHLQSILGKTPVFVRLKCQEISRGQFSILVKNNFVPILVDEGSDFIYNTPSPFVIPYFNGRLQTLPENQSIVSLSQCTGIQPYI